MTIRILLLLVPLLWMCAATGFAQDDPGAGDTDGSSEQVESSDEAYRRRMELEDARRQDPSYTDPIDTYKKDLEKIDKLPEESRDNIRDQLVDVIVDNGEWEPSDALEDYPYEPTEAAKKDPVLMEQEQEAWDEQIEKYHEREAAAFGTYRGPVPGPGNPTGQQGGPGGESGEPGQGAGQAGGQGPGAQGGGNGSGTAGTYQAGGTSGEEDAASTAGVSESALDFLRGRQAGSGGGAGAPGQDASSSGGEAGSGERSAAGTGTAGSSASSDRAADSATAGAQQSAADWAAQAAAAAESANAATESAEEAASEATEEALELDTRGIIAIEDLDKLEGTVPAEPDPEEQDR